MLVLCQTMWFVYDIYLCFEANVMHESDSLTKHNKEKHQKKNQKRKKKIEKKSSFIGVIASKAKRETWDGIFLYFLFLVLFLMLLLFLLLVRLSDSCMKFAPKQKQMSCTNRIAWQLEEGKEKESEKANIEKFQL